MPLLVGTMERACLATSVCTLDLVLLKESLGDASALDSDSDDCGTGKSHSRRREMVPVNGEDRRNYAAVSIHWKTVMRETRLAHRSCSPC